jgi:hypothetical protein
MRVVRAVEHDACLVWSVMPGSDGADGAAGSIDALMDVNSVDADGFTFIMDDAVPASPANAWVVMVGETAAADTNEAAVYVPVITRNPLNVMY